MRLGGATDQAAKAERNGGDTDSVLLDEVDGIMTETIFVSSVQKELAEERQAIRDFVMSKINRAVGTRAESSQAPVTYELPREAISEAIVNAVSHRDYTSNASVQVMLFADRLEVWNPGELPPPLTPELLRVPHASIPRNPLIADPMFLARYAEKAGSGILDMIARCREAGLPAPQFRQEGGQFIQTLRRPRPSVAPEPAGQVTGVVGDQVGTKWGLSGDQVRVLQLLPDEQSLAMLMKVFGRSNRTKFRDQVVRPLIDMGLVEMTIPGKPRSSKQKYRLTTKGRAWLADATEG